jgi:chromosome partitioning protein
MGKIITVVNQKGGVGKTTICCHLAFAAQDAGKRVLVVDFDTQGNASQFLSQDLRINKRKGGSEQIFGDGEIKYTDLPADGMKLLHGHGYLEGLDERKDDILKQATTLRQKVRALPFDYVIFDTPPSIGPRIAAPLFWSDLALVTIQPKLASMTGLDSTFDTIKSVQRVNPGLAMRMVVNLFSRSSATQKRMRADLAQKFGNAILHEFSMRVAVSDALENFKPVWKHSRDKKLNEEWKSFAARVLELNA